MGFICLECYKDRSLDDEHLDENGSFDINIVAVSLTKCEICGKEGDCIDRTYAREKLQDLFIKGDYITVEKVLNFEDFTSYYEKALEVKGFGMYTEEIPEDERDDDYYDELTKVRKIEKIIQDQLIHNETIKCIYFVYSKEQLSYEVSIKDQKIYFKSETFDYSFNLIPTERERLEEALYDRDMSPKYNLNLFLAIGQFDNSLLKKLKNEGLNCEELHKNTLLFIETIEFEDGIGDCELIYNYTEDNYFTIRNLGGRPFKLIEWCKQYF